MRFDKNDEACAQNTFNGNKKKAQVREEKTITVIVSTPTGVTGVLLDSTASSPRSPDSERNQ